MSKLNTKNTTWNLKPLLDSDTDPNLESKRKITKEYTESFINKWKNREDYLENADTLKEALDDYEELSNGYFGKGEEGTSNSEGYYFWLRVNQDQLDTNLKAKYNKSEEFSLKLRNDLEFFELNLGKIKKENQELFLKNKNLENYNTFLKRIFDSSKHFLSENEEKIMNLKSQTSYENWIKVVEEFLSSEEKEVLTSDGKTQIKTIEEILSLLLNKDKDVRDDAAKKLNEILDKHKNLAEFELNSILLDKKVNDEIRNIPYPEYSRYLKDDLEKDVVDSLIKNVSDRFDISKDYYEFKSKLLGFEKLKYHERNLPFGKIEKEYSYEESIDLVFEVLNNLDSKFGEIVKKLVENGNIDVYPKKGKSGGAFCVHWLKSQPTYVLLNHTNKLRDVLTIAHELGHAINNELIKEKQNSLNFGTSTATAEVASTFMEDFVLEKIKSEADEELKLSILVQKLDDVISTIFRQVAAFKFEQELHNEFRKKGHLSNKEIGELFQKHMKSYMGDFVSQDKGSENWWVYWSHFRRFFYVYSYAFGLLISKSMQRNVREDKEFIEKVKEFLSTGKSKYPKDTFLDIGIDITKDEFWQKGIKEIEDLFNETKELAKKLGKI